VERTIAVAGPRQADAVWADYADLSRWSVWSPPISWVQATSERLTTGLSGTVLVLGKLRVPFTVESVDHEQRVWEWEVSLTGRKIWMRHEVVERVGGGSVATLTVAGPTPLAVGYPEVARLALHRLVR
jgi:hypothetical protein